MVMVCICDYQTGECQGPLDCKAVAEAARLRAMILDACEVFDHYDLPEHAFHYRRELAKDTTDGTP